LKFQNHLTSNQHHMSTLYFYIVNGKKEYNSNTPRRHGVCLPWG